MKFSLWICSWTITITYMYNCDGHDNEDIWFTIYNIHRFYFLISEKVHAELKARCRYHMLYEIQCFTKRLSFENSVLYQYVTSMANALSISTGIKTVYWYEFSDFDEHFMMYSVSGVCVRLSQLSQLSHMQYKGLCVFILPISLMVVVRILVYFFPIVIIISEVWPICHCLGLGHETAVCAVCLSIFSYEKPSKWLSSSPNRSMWIVHTYV